MIGVRAAVTATVEFCTRRPWLVVILAAVLAAVSAAYAVGHFAITTDTERLLPDNLPWRQHQLAYQAVFPEHQILAVVEASTPELADIASARLAARLRQHAGLFTSVLRPQDGAFFEHESLLFLPPRQVTAITAMFAENRPMLALLAGDPSLRGAMAALTRGIEAEASGRLPPTWIVRPATLLSDMLDRVFAGHFASFPWRAAIGSSAGSGGNASRQFIEIDPKLDYKSLEPGAAATAAIDEAVRRLGLAARYGAKVELTGRAPINDAQFAALGHEAIPAIAGTIAAVVVILWLAVRSARIVGAVLATLMAGFVTTAALGLVMAGAFNLISVAFAVLFIGLGADFGIQYSVRYRAERHDQPEIRAALRNAAEKAGEPLSLAAAGTATGFLSFLPTDYRGIAELGEIAGVGMLVAFAMTITLLPALLSLLNPPSEPERMGFAALAPVDRFLARHRIVIVVVTLVGVVGGLPLLSRMHFDFDPIHLQNQHDAAVATYRALSHDPVLGIDAVNIAVPSVGALAAVARRVGALPEVAGTRSIADLVPADQAPKLAVIDRAAASLLPALDPAAVMPPPSDGERIRSIRAAAVALGRLDRVAPGPAAAAARRLRTLLTRLADAGPRQRDIAATALVLPLKRDLDRLRDILRPQPVSAASVPSAIARDWVAADGRARLEILPKGNPTKTATLRRFANAVLRVAPDASGMPIELVQSERTVLRAFIEAGALAVVAMGVILWVVLRRFGDVLLTLVPLLVAGTLTLELMVVFGQSMNFANVIALPLLLGVGVAFKIYYVMAWRAGRTNLLQSTLTRAVVFSALTTATAFGSLWLSNQPGISSMGRLMSLALACTLAAAVLFQPALMGPPRRLPGEMAGPGEPTGDPPLQPRHSG